METTTYSLQTTQPSTEANNPMTEAVTAVQPPTTHSKVAAMGASIASYYKCTYPFHNI